MSKQKSIHISFDECGESAGFNLPVSALKDTSGMYTISDKTLNKLTMLHYREVDRSDVLIHDLDDKIALVNRLRKHENKWV